MPDNLLSRIKKPELSIADPLLATLFLRVNINGTEASYSADKVAQTVPGALLNQAAIEAYSHSGTPYLPESYFSKGIDTFFTSSRQPLRTKKDLKLSEFSAGETVPMM